MQPQFQIPNCPNCNATLVKSQKPDKLGRDYFKCPNWKPRDEGCEGYIFTPLAPQKRTTVLLGANNNDLISGRLNTIEKLIMEEFKTINTRLNNMAQYISENIKKAE